MSFYLSQAAVDNTSRVPKGESRESRVVSRELAMGYGIDGPSWFDVLAEVWRGKITDFGNQTMTKNVMEFREFGEFWEFIAFREFFGDVGRASSSFLRFLPAVDKAP